MGMSPRLALLLATAVLGVQGPPHRSPGFRRGKKAVKTVTCPKEGCLEQGRWESGFRYRCTACNDPFYYCPGCSNYMDRSDATGHGHPAG
jgi:hypothetical protein